MTFIYFKALSQIDVTHHFSIVNNRVILNIVTSKDENLNFLFDSASNDFLLDSVTALKYNLVDKNSTIHKLQFVNGTIDFKEFENKNFFKDSLLNKIYRSGKIVSIRGKDIGLSIPVNGVIGINRIMEKYILCLDFENGKLNISSHLVNNNKSFYYTDLIYSDNQHSNGLSKYYHSLSSVKIRFKLTNTVSIITNARFDTGCNKEFVVFSSDNIDSLFKITNRKVNIINRKISLGSETHKVYEFKADSVIIDDKLGYTNKLIQVTEIGKGAMPEFGDLQNTSLIGTPFLKNFKKIILNFPEKKIFFIN